MIILRSVLFIIFFLIFFFLLLFFAKYIFRNITDFFSKYTYNHIRRKNKQKNNKNKYVNEIGTNLTYFLFYPFIFNYRKFF